jgi:hypothetical protein
MDLLPRIDDQLLKDIGVSSAGQRLRIRKRHRQTRPHCDCRSKSRERRRGDSREVPLIIGGFWERTGLFCGLVGSTA